MLQIYFLMTKLSVNINKIATLRNSRGGDTPNLLQFAKDVQEFGAQVALVKYATSIIKVSDLSSDVNELKVNLLVKAEIY